MPPRSRRTRWRVDSFLILYPCRVRPSSSCVPEKMRRCWSGGMSIWSWILALTFSRLSFPLIWIVMVLPVRVFTKICIQPLGSLVGAGDCAVALFAPSTDRTCFFNVGNNPLCDRIQRIVGRPEGGRGRERAKTVSEKDGGGGAAAVPLLLNKITFPLPTRCTSWCEDPPRLPRDTDVRQWRRLHIWRQHRQRCTWQPGSAHM